MNHSVRIIRVVVCKGDKGLGTNQGLLDAADKARWFRRRFDDAIAGVDAVEFSMWDRQNRGGLLYPKTAKWQRMEGPIWDAFVSFLMDLSAVDLARVQVALPFPTRRSHIAEIMSRLTPRVSVRFEDCGNRAPSLMKRIRPLVDAGFKIGIDTIPTDSVSLPGRATRLAIPRGAPAVVWGARARIVADWRHRGVAVTVPLSVLFTGDDDDALSADEMEWIRTHAGEVRLQNASAAVIDAVWRWRGVPTPNHTPAVRGGGEG